MRKLKIKNKYGIVAFILIFLISLTIVFFVLSSKEIINEPKKCSKYYASVPYSQINETDEILLTLKYLATRDNEITNISLSDEINSKLLINVTLKEGLKSTQKNTELSRIKKELEVKHNITPSFFGYCYYTD